MIIYKCKMCGGNLEIQDGMGVCECAYCGTKQTLPKLNDEKRANLYDRANHFRRNNEFDKAMAMYEQILAEDREDAEAYWSLVLCTYGVEYVEDPISHRKVPTVNRTQYTSVFMDENYKAALQYADDSQKQIYRDEAEQIDSIQKGILDISSKEKPYDIFICYKETDAKGERTPDSVLAQDLYYQLTQEGLKVFFSRITLEDKLGSVYEPYIFAALNSAMVMVVVGTRAEYFNAVWVKNEWSRYLNLIKGGAKKVLIPAYKDMDPYDMPQEFSHLQAQDMSKLGFMQDLLRGVKKIVGADNAPLSGAASGSGQQQETAALIKRVFLVLEDGDFVRADELCEKVLNQDPENGEAYLAKLMISLKVDRREKLAQLEKGISKLDNYAKIIRFGSEALKAEVDGYQQQIIERQRRQKEENDERVYKDALEHLQRSKKSSDIELALNQLKAIADYKDVAERIKETEKRLQQAVRSELTRKIKLIAAAVIGVIVLVIVIKGYKAITDNIARREQRNEAQANAEALMQEGEYEEAYTLFHEISEDSTWMEEMLNAVTDYLEREEYETAIEVFRCAHNHKTAETTEIMRNELITALEQSLENGKMETAEWIVGWLSEVGFSEKTGIILSAALDRSLDSGEQETAEVIFKWLSEEKVPGSEDAQAHFLEIKNKQALEYIENGELDQAAQILENYRFSSVVVNNGWDEYFVEAIYNLAMKYCETGDYITGYDLLVSLENYDNAKMAMTNVCEKRLSQLLRSTEKYGVVTFGRYEQDNILDNGMEDIEWIVLEKQEGRCLLLSKYILGYMEETNLLWENSSVREWMNSDFYETAFDSNEKAVITNTTLDIDEFVGENIRVSLPVVDSGMKTEDKVFALSVTEVLQYDPGPTYYLAASSTIVAESFNSSLSESVYLDSFWSRTAGPEWQGLLALEKGAYGWIGISGVSYLLTVPSCGIRPAIWVRMD